MRRIITSDPGKMTNPDDEDLRVFIDQLNQLEPKWPEEEQDDHT